MVYEVNEYSLKLKDSTLYPHYKQCRKLEEIKPREFYIHVDSFEDLSTMTVSYDGKPDAIRGIIKVREVIE